MPPPFISSFSISCSASGAGAGNHHLFSSVPPPPSINDLLPSSFSLPKIHLKRRAHHQHKLTGQLHSAQYRDSNAQNPDLGSESSYGDAHEGQSAHSYRFRVPSSNTQNPNSHSKNSTEYTSHSYRSRFSSTQNPNSHHKPSTCESSHSYRSRFSTAQNPNSHSKPSTEYTSHSYRSKFPVTQNPNSTSTNRPAFKATHLKTHYHKPVDPTSKTLILNSTEEDRSVLVTRTGVSYRLPGAPFDFQFSYSETPRVAPIAIREPAFLPFAPPSMPRPWTGKAPLLSKKEKEIKKGKRIQLVEPLGSEIIQREGLVKQVLGKKGLSEQLRLGLCKVRDQRTREEVLGEPLTRYEIRKLVKPHLSHNRQVNLGRDGLTHNMLELVHCHWRRDEVCKVRCRGVPTIDMQNICQCLEEKTGGKVIYKTGGILYLFRGRHYDPRVRPRYPIMLWKPATPVYPKLIQKIPEGLTEEEAGELRGRGEKLLPICKLGRHYDSRVRPRYPIMLWIWKPATPVYPKLIQKVPEGLTVKEAGEMRERGEKLLPICKLAKNGIYINLVKEVREAFEASELVKIDCEGMHGSDYKKLGAKLKELVPCVLLSFDNDQILIYRGKTWKSRYRVPLFNHPISNSNFKSSDKITQTDSSISGESNDTRPNMKNPSDEIKSTSPKMLLLYNRAIESSKALKLQDSELSNLNPNSLLEKVEKFEYASQALKHSFPSLHEINEDETQGGLVHEEEIDQEEINENICDEPVPYGSLPIDLIVGKLGEE